jgi:hypothetical protein
MNIYYVYAYLRKSDNTPYYIGKGKNDRAFKGIHNVSIPKDKTKISILEENLSEEDAFLLETELIKQYGRIDLGTGILRNRTDGGEGVRGLPRTDNHNKKISESCKGKSKPKSREHKAKIQEYMDTHHTGKSYSEIYGEEKANEIRKKISSSGKGRVVSEETREKIRIAQQGKPRKKASLETREKMRRAHALRLAK